MNARLDLEASYTLTGYDQRCGRRDRMFSTHLTIWLVGFQSDWIARQYGDAQESRPVDNDRFYGCRVDRGVDF